MIGVKCDTKDHVKLADCEPFQGNLKKRSQQDLDELKQSLVTEGLLMPFAIWEHDGKKLLLDGHGRREVLLAMNDPEVAEYEWPCVYVKADTEDDARKALLQITSQYGKITKVGYRQFTVTIPNYVTPSVKRFAAAQVSKKVSVPKAQKGLKVIKVRVPEDRYKEVLDVFKQIDYIEVL